MAAVHLNQAAIELGIRPDTLRSWLRRGAPCVRCGSRGRGHSALLEVDKVRAWRNRRTEDAPLVAVDDLLLAEGLAAAFRSGDHHAVGISDADAAAVLALSFRYLHRAATGWPPETYPAAVEALARIATGHRV